MVKSLLITGCILLVLISCKKQSSPYNWVEFYDCHTKQTWDATKVRDQLVGTWQWESYACGEGVEGRYVTANTDVTIQFYPDSTLEVLENGQITDSAVWHVTGNGPYRLDANPFVGRTIGGIYFCEDLLLFENVSADACNDYYRRIK